MSGTINLGDNYTVEEDSNGDLVITDSGGSTVLKHDDSADKFVASESFDTLEAADASVTNSPSSDGDVGRFQELSERGQVTANGSDNTGLDGTWDTVSVTTVTFTFDTAFGSTPDVVAVKDADAQSMFKYQVEVRNKSTTSVNIRFLEFHSGDKSPKTMAANISAGVGR